VTFVATIKIEHILERREVFPELAALGCAFVVSAVESLSEGVLRHLKKGHTRADVTEVLDILDDAGIPMRPTFVAFTPWTNASDYLDVLGFIAEHELIEHVDPIQYAIRLLVPPNSALLDDPDGRGWLGPLDEEALSYTWQHPDPRMDALQREVQALVEHAASQREPIAVTFAAIRSLAAEQLEAREPALVVAGISDTTGTMRRSRQPIPHLSEPWFC
jgi:hypothetical protein